MKIRYRGKIFCKVLIKKNLSQLNTVLISSNQKWKGAAAIFHIKASPISIEEPLKNTGLIKLLNKKTIDPILWTNKYFSPTHPELWNERPKTLTNVNRLSSKQNHVTKTLADLNPNTKLRNQRSNKTNTRARLRICEEIVNCKFIIETPPSQNDFPYKNPSGLENCEWGFNWFTCPSQTKGLMKFWFAFRPMLRSSIS